MRIAYNRARFDTEKKFIMRTVGIMLLLLLCMQGCGRKGPLYLPQAQAGFDGANPPTSQDKASHE